MQQFLKACGAAGPLQVEILDRSTAVTLRRTLTRPFALVGRDEKADLPLMHPAVSQRHAYLQVIDGRVFCVDLASRAGVRWPDGPRPSGWLGVGETLEMGPFLVRLLGGVNAEAAPPADDPLTSRQVLVPGLPVVELEIHGEGGRRKLWAMSRRLALVGRLPFCKVQLAAEAVSRVHCALVRTADGVWVVDLLGRGGVRVNGRPVRTACLQDGDRVGVAPFHIVVYYKATASPEALSIPDFELPPVENFALDVPPAPTHSVVPVPADPPADTNELVKVFLMPLASQFCMMQQQMFEQFQQAMKMAHTFNALHERQVDLIRRELDRQAELTRELQALQRELNAARPAPPPAAPARMLARGPAPASETPAPAKLSERKPKYAAAPPSAAGSDTNGDVHNWLAHRIDAIQKDRESSWETIKRALLGGAKAESAP